MLTQVRRSCQFSQLLFLFSASPVNIFIIKVFDLLILEQRLESQESRAWGSGKIKNHEENRGFGKQN